MILIEQKLQDQNTGEIEVHADKVSILNPALRNLPFNIRDKNKVHVHVQCSFLFQIGNHYINPSIR